MILLLSGGDNSQNMDPNPNNVENWCLLDGCYTFAVFDDYGDGMNGANPEQHGQMEIILLLEIMVRFLEQLLLILTLKSDITQFFVASVTSSWRLLWEM